MKLHKLKYIQLHGWSAGKSSHFWVCVILLLLCFSRPIFPLEVPPLSGRVVDSAGMLSARTVEEINALLEQHEKETSNQVVVLTIPSLEGDILEEYSLKAAEIWKLGKKGTDNGVLLLIAKNDRKMRIEVGYGLEGNLTDGICSRIIRNEITPKFKSGDFDGGTLAGVKAILATIKGTYTPTEESAVNTGGSDLTERIITGLIFFVVVGIFTLIAIFTPGAGWFFYVILIPFWYAFPSIIFTPLVAKILTIIYIIAIPILKFLFKTSSFKGSGSSGGSYSSGSSWGSSSSRSWGSSSSSGGGFSGGGGSFGGGGSSGSW